MAQGLPISTFVRISTQIAAGGVLRTDFGLGLIVTTTDALPAGGPDKMRLYRDVEAVQADNHAGEALAAARVWFGADPAPQSLYIGRWATTDVDTTLTGREPSVAANMGALNASNASFRINSQDFSAIDLSTSATYAAIATALQTAIQSAGTPFASATVVYDSAVNSGSGGFVFDFANDTAITGGAWAQNLDANGNVVGTDVSSALGFADPTSYKQGHATETLAAALAEMVPLGTNGAPVLPMVDGSCPSAVGAVDTRESLAAFIQAGDYFGFIRDNGTDPLITNETTSFSAHVFSEGLSKVETVIGDGENFGTGTNYTDVAANALLSSQQLNLPAQIITPHLKGLPGASSQRIDGTQLAEATRKRASVYTVVGGTNSLAGGYTGSAGTWADAQYWLLWLKNEMELNIFNAQRASKRFNTAILTDTVTQVMATAVRSGGIQEGGSVNAGVKNEISKTFSLPEFDGVLPTGWMLWVENPSLRSDADRENRRGRFSVWISPADAIHEVTSTITLSG